MAPGLAAPPGCGCGRDVPCFGGRTIHRREEVMQHASPRMVRVVLEAEVREEPFEMGTVADDGSVERGDPATPHADLALDGVGAHAVVQTKLLRVVIVAEH